MEEIGGRTLQKEQCTGFSCITVPVTFEDIEKSSIETQDTQFKSKNKVDEMKTSYHKCFDKTNSGNTFINEFVDIDNSMYNTSSNNKELEEASIAPSKDNSNQNKLPENTDISETSTKTYNQSGSTMEESSLHTSQANKKELSENTSQCPEEISKEVPLYAPDTGPHWYDVTGNVVTQPVITKNLPDIFESLPVHGRPKSKAEIDVFLDKKVREFVGDITDEDYDNLSEFCSPKHLETGLEMKMSTSLPATQSCPMVVEDDMDVGSNLHINMKLKLRKEMDKKNMYSRKLKYRKVKLMPPPEDDDLVITIGEPLKPGTDLVFRVRVYRLFHCSTHERSGTRHSLLSSDIVLLGRQPLTALRDRIVCLNEMSTSVDVSEAPDDLPSTSAKDLFPSGFLFINNVFYVDSRAGCADHAAALREWAARRGLGRFPARDMAVRLQDVPLRLGHPDVYLHQGDCEHLFTFSEARLLHARDPLQLSRYPLHGQLAQTQAVYCTTCAEFGTKWIVADCERVPFDPTFFCDRCFRLYLYRDGRKTCDFKAYVYKGNEINILKPFK